MMSFWMVLSSAKLPISRYSQDTWKEERMVLWLIAIRKSRYDIELKGEIRTQPLLSV